MALWLSERPDRLLRLPGVYAPQYDTRAMMRAIRAERLGPGSSVLDIGTGSGALALYAARTGARVTAIDITRRAVVCARLNAALAGQRITVRRADLATPGRRFDVVISNPPYVPTPGRLREPRGAARAWDAGHDGRSVVDRICAAAPGMLRPGGVLLMVHSALSGTGTTLDRLREAGLTAEVIDRELIPLGPVLRSRLPWLREQRLLEEGEDKEELVVIRAERP
ncbi:HemK2/MTQ2 family protein methyltransferase [Streptomyces sp. NBC_01190]|uniref:HemK2/MTQ2 family protein methyltransferase n=1 Tax=Streptomyces sp. NBC_01190 TaxID=2903767 RepID=UPI0038683033|nr:class I SAM-dependent methyltransferase [Streptomyces sp. NBC_01190]